MHRTLAERFWEKVGIRSPDECWEWAGYCDNNGYGRIGEGGKRGRILIASRLSWELHNGPIPDGLWVLHRCDNPSCVNPGHLFLGTQRDNVLDMYAKGRGNRPRGEAHVCARLTAEAIAEIRSTYMRGSISQRALGQQFGVSNVAISRIVRHKTWAHV